MSHVSCEGFCSCLPRVATRRRGCCAGWGGFLLRVCLWWARDVIGVRDGVKHVMEYLGGRDETLRCVDLERAERFGAGQKFYIRSGLGLLD